MEGSCEHGIEPSGSVKCWEVYSIKREVSMFAGLVLLLGLFHLAMLVR
jgi:hypothetical protein